MPGSDAGTDGLEAAHGRFGDFLDAGLLAAVLAGDDHAGFQDRAFEHHVLLVQRAEQRAQRGFGDFVADFDDRGRRP